METQSCVNVCESSLQSGIRLTENVEVGSGEYQIFKRNSSFWRRARYKAGSQAIKKRSHKLIVFKLKSKRVVHEDKEVLSWNAALIKT